MKGAGIDTHTVAIKGRKQFITDADELIEFAERLVAEQKAKGEPFRAAWLVQIREFKERLEHLIAGSQTDEPTEQAEAEHLLAEFSRVSIGASRWADRIKRGKG